MLELILQANGVWTPFGDVTTITTKDSDARTGIGMRLSEKGHMVGPLLCFRALLTAVPLLLGTADSCSAIY
jgi:hypothetical protein